MEFPSAGSQCSLESCQQLDFLPFTCSHCKLIFCKEHFHVMHHCCLEFLETTTKTTYSTFKRECTVESCKAYMPVQMPCKSCNRHYCIKHRFHGCFSQNMEESMEKLAKFAGEQHSFLREKKTVERRLIKELPEKFSPLAHQIHFTKLKLKSQGPQTIPISDRRYFLVCFPINRNQPKKPPKAAFVSVHWTIGRVIDSLAESLGIPNMNNVASATKLRLFKYSTGCLISKTMDEPLADLLSSNTLEEGKRVILEYSNKETLSAKLYLSREEDTTDMTS